MLNLQILKEKFPQILEVYEDKGQSVVKTSAESILEILKFCQHDPQFSMNFLMDIVAVDYWGEIPRFEVVYILYSMTHKQHLRLKVRVAENQALPSAVSLYANADWAEREIFDMMGIKFQGHPNLKRILMFESFEGHPLRRDYPVNLRQKIPVVDETP